MRISNNRYDRDRRRYDLAQQMIELDARTTTVARWTGLSIYRVQTLFRSYQPRHARPRGYPPSQPAFFSRTLAMECESATLASIAWTWQIIPAQILPDATKSLPSLTRGEHLVRAFELYRNIVPNPRITLEYAVLLMTELATRQTLSLGRCERCKSLMLMNRLHVPHELCPYCRSRRHAPAVPLFVEEKSAPSAVIQVREGSWVSQGVGSQCVQQRLIQHDEKHADAGQDEDDGRWKMTCVK
jgi:hypothetical protein